MVKVSSENGLIKRGDAITTSTIPGTGMKIDKAGPIIGKSMDKFDPSQLTCTPVATAESAPWLPFEDPALNPNGIPKNECFVLPDGTYLTRLTVFVTPSWYDPSEDTELRLANLEDGNFVNGLNIAPNLSGSNAEKALNIGDGWDANIYFDDTTANVQVANGGSIVFEDADGTDLLSMSKTALSVNLDDTTYFSEKLCHSGIDGETGVVSVGDCSGTPGDYAEQYGTSDASLSAGDVVMIDPEREVEQIEQDGRKGSKAWIMKAVSSDNQRLLGVVSTDPNDVIGQNFTASENARPVALNGRVPVKINAEGGPIASGDFLTASTTPGVATRATKAGMVLGRALE